MLLRDDPMGRAKGCSQPLTPLCTAQTNSTAQLPQLCQSSAREQSKPEKKKKIKRNNIRKHTLFVRKTGPEPKCRFLAQNPNAVEGRTCVYKVFSVLRTFIPN